jgi:hypothetical protein
VLPPALPRKSARQTKDPGGHLEESA